MRLKALASGSNGNCIYINGGDTHILIDAGISCKRITQGLKELNVDPRELSGIFVTHEHSDHTGGLPVFSRHYRIPLYGTEGTLREVAEQDVKGEIDPGLYHIFPSGSELSLKELRIRSIRICHDAADPSAYRVEAGGKKVCVMTDTGRYTEEMVEELQDLSGILLESNHDIRMLETGPYPYSLKRRIISEHGHLSNESAAEFLTKILNPGLRFVLLGHISEDNNYPDIALMTVKNELAALPKEQVPEDLVLSAATRFCPSDLFEV